MKSKKLLLFVLVAFYSCNLAYANAQQDGDSYDYEIENLTAQLDEKKSHHLANKQEETMVCQALSPFVSEQADSISQAHNGVMPEFIRIHMLSYLESWFTTMDKNEDGIYILSGLKMTNLEQTQSKIEECEKQLEELKSTKASYDEALESGDTSKASQLEEALKQKIMMIKQMLYNLYVDIDWGKMMNRFVTCFKKFMISVNDVYEKDNVRTTNIDGIDWTYTIDKTSMTCEVGAVYVFSDGEGVRAEIKTAIDRSVAGEVAIPSEIDGYKVIGILESTFYGCNDMTSLIIPNSVESIREDTFSGCKGLAYVQLPDNLKELPVRCFYNCSSLVSVNLPSAITAINLCTFYGCTNLTTLDIPLGVTTIGESAFQNSGLVEVDIPQGVESIGYSAFKDCGSLKRVFIPKTVRRIGVPEWHNGTHWYTAFDNTPSLTSITVEEGNTVFDSRNGCNAIIETATDELIQGCQSTIIPDDVETIGAGAFTGQTEMSSIIIPANIKAIGGNTFGERYYLAFRDGAFYKCTGLAAVYSNNNNPFEIHESVFGNAYYNSPEDERYLIYKQATLYVPIGSEQKYRETEGWKLFTHIVGVDFQSGISTNSVTEDGNAPVYNLHGQRVNKPTKGLFIMNGRKVMVK